MQTLPNSAVTFPPTGFAVEPITAAPPGREIIEFVRRTYPSTPKRFTDFIVVRTTRLLPDGGTFQTVAIRGLAGTALPDCPCWPSEPHALIECANPSCLRIFCRPLGAVCQSCGRIYCGGSCLSMVLVHDRFPTLICNVCAERRLPLAARIRRALWRTAWE